MNNIQEIAIRNELRKATIASNFQETNIEKGGEGSRGGKIIGHTKSGKAIYESHHNVDSGTKGWSKQDHKDAAEAHTNAKNDHLASIHARGKEMGFNEKKERKELAQKHEMQAHGHKMAADAMPDEDKNEYGDAYKKHGLNHKPKGESTGWTENKEDAAGYLAAEPGDYSKHEDDYSIVHSPKDKMLYYHSKKHDDEGENATEIPIKDSEHLDRVLTDIHEAHKDGRDPFPVGGDEGKSPESHESVRDWSGSHLKDEHIQSIVDSLADKGIEDKDLKIKKTANWSPEKESEAINNKVEELKKEHQPGLEHADMDENDIHDVLWGMVRSAHHGGHKFFEKAETTEKSLAANPEISKAFDVIEGDIEKAKRPEGKHLGLVNIKRGGKTFTQTRMLANKPVNAEKNAMKQATEMLKELYHGKLSNEEWGKKNTEYKKFIQKNKIKNEKVSAALQKEQNKKMVEEMGTGADVFSGSTLEKNLSKYLPKAAINDLKDAYGISTKSKVVAKRDPLVETAVAVRVDRQGNGKDVFDLLWDGRGRGEWEEVEFASWPPKSGGLKF